MPRKQDITLEIKKILERQKAVDEIRLKGLTEEKVSAPADLLEQAAAKECPEGEMRGEKAFFQARENVIEKIEFNPDSEEERSVRCDKAKAAYAVFQAEEPETFEVRVVTGLNIRA